MKTKQYINKDALVAKIESEKKYAQTLANNAINNSMQQFYDGMKEGLDKLLSFIEILEVQPLSNQWSAEDEKMLNDANGAVAIADYYTYDDKQKIETWLKSLKQRYTWVPSKKQIEALEWALSLAKNCGEECAFDLRTLSEQLNKLRL